MKKVFLFSSFLLAGLFFGYLMLSTFIFNYINVKNSTSEVLSYKTEIEIKDNSENLIFYKIYFYKVNGQEFTCKNINGTTTMPRDNNEIIHYNPNNPSACIIDYMYKIDWILLPLLLLPLLFVFIGYMGLTIVLKNLYKNNNLYKYGTLYRNYPFTIKYLEPEMENLDQGAGIALIDFKHPNGSIHKLESDIMEVTRTQISDGVDILINLNKPENYYINFNINLEEYKKK